MNSRVEKGKASEQMTIFESVLKWRNVFAETADRVNTFADLYGTKDTNVLSLQFAFKLLMLRCFRTIFS